MHKSFKLGISFVFLLFVGCTATNSFPDVSDTEVNSDTSAIVIDKEKNMCEQDSDCKYIWFTGGCNTPEYVDLTLNQAQKKGLSLGEAPRIDEEKVTCSCENNKCVTVIDS